MSELDQLLGELSTDGLVELEQLLRQADATYEWLRAKAEEPLELPE